MLIDNEVMGVSERFVIMRMTVRLRPLPAFMRVLVMFIVNVLGQLWGAMAPLRPFSVFYYYQPQKIMLKGDWSVELGNVWNGGEPLLALNVVVVLFAMGALGYLAAYDSRHLKDLARACIPVCETCEKECREHEEHQAECKDCADACALVIREAKKLLA